MRIGITCYPTYGGSGAVATELGLELARRGHEVHFISYASPFRLRGGFAERVTFHEVVTADYPLFEHSPYALALAVDRKSTRLNSSHGYISYAVFCLKKKNTNTNHLTSCSHSTRHKTHDPLISHSNNRPLNDTVYPIQPPVYLTDIARHRTPLNPTYD